jgi:uncharacterized protein
MRNFMRQHRSSARAFGLGMAFVVSASLLSSCMSPNAGPSDAASTGGAPASSSGGAGGAATGAGGVGGGDAGLGASGGAAGAPVDAVPMAGDASVDAPPARPGKALIYIFSNLYFRHPSIETAAGTLELALKDRGYTVEISKDQKKFSTAGLADFTLIIMIGSCGEPLGQPETASVAALDAWLKAGGALVGIHAASAVAYPPTSRFVAIMGGRFVDHPGNLRPAVCTPQGNHPSVVGLPTPFNVRDEIYVHDGYNATNQVDLQCAGVDGAPLPIAWHRTEGMGRVFYSALGHEIGDWIADGPLVKNHVLPGILWATGR